MNEEDADTNLTNFAQLANAIVQHAGVAPSETNLFLKGSIYRNEIDRIKNAFSALNPLIETA